MSVTFSRSPTQEEKGKKRKKERKKGREGEKTRECASGSLNLDQLCASLLNMI